MGALTVAKGLKPVALPKSNQKNLGNTLKTHIIQSNEVERSFRRINEFATRCEKLDVAFVTRLLLVVFIMLQNWRQDAIGSLSMSSLAIRRTRLIGRTYDFAAPLPSVLLL